jgi:ElaA protein
MINFRCKPFYELTVSQLYAIIALRLEIFVLEQNCPYQDCDGIDSQSWHMMGFNDDGKIVAYARLIPKGVAYENHASLGRVLTDHSIRRTGIGRALMKEVLEKMDQLFPNENIKIGAQAYLREFYECFGFVVSGPEYLEDGIPHFPMVRG